ncbi:MAG: HAD-IA family hydrolase [Candidatus Eremiobacteraeota bacterium]|nr:HAD-IA family hydrolase [Candidatus Eremiobacteraeota bacterium]
MIEAVLFDLDDTLHDDTLTYRRAAERVAGDVARERGIDARVLLQAYVALAEAFWQTLSADMFGTPLVGVRGRMWRSALEAVAIDDAELAERSGAAYNRYRREYLQLWPGAPELLARLRVRGMKLALITNGFAETHREKLELLRLEDAFDEVFIADEVGLLKPDPRIFALAAERLGVAAPACAMVGDRFERDIRGAQEAGMFTVWMNVRDEAVPPGAAPPNAIVARIDEVEGVLPLARKA